MQGPQAPVFMLLFRESATNLQDFFMPQSGNWGKLSLRESPSPGWKLGWNVPGQTPKGMCIIPSPLLFVVRICMSLIIRDIEHFAMSFFFKCE